MRANILKVLPVAFAALMLLGTASDANAQRRRARIKKAGHGHVAVKVGVRKPFRPGRRICGVKPLPRPVCTPRPHVHTSCCRKKFIPGRIRIVCERVWVPGCSRKVWVPPVYKWVCTPCGGRKRVVVRPGFFRIVRTPGFYKNVRRKVRGPGRWIFACGN